MRIVLFAFLICAAGVTLAGASISECAAIESAVERLDCYDRLARREAQGTEVAEHPSGGLPPERAATKERPPAAGPSPADRPKGPEEGAVSAFGKPPERTPEEDLTHIQARIDSIRKAPRGEQIFTLSNGQVWMENEPGGRPVEPGQDVTIRKRFWFYEMDLKAQPDVGVRRVR